MFTRVEQLGLDLDAVAAGDELPDTVWAPDDHELGPALIAAASGKYAWLDEEANRNDSAPRARRLTAQRYVAAAMFHPDSTLYALLAARPDASATALRDNYRRMIALVHPDTQPVGFPIDAATRVNRAYDVLSDTTKRAAYDVTLQRTEASRAVSSESKSQPDRTRDGNGGTSKSARSRVGLLRRFSLRASRRSLLWLAAGLTVSAGAIVYLSADTDAGVALVEARPKLEMSNSVATEVRAEPAGSADARPEPLTPSRTVTGEIASPAQRLSTELSAASRRIIDAVTPVIAAASVKATATPDQTTKLASSPRASPSPPASAKLNSLAATPSAYQSADTDLAKQTTPADTITTKEKADTSPKGPVVSSATQAPASAMAGSAAMETPQRIRAVDVDELLARFASAYESGSAPALAALLSQAMPNRRATLSDYEHVFQETRQRTIRFSQVKHKWIGDQVTTSGLITLTTLGLDGQSTRQNAFLEIETTLEANSLRVTRLANYAQR